MDPGRLQTSWLVRALDTRIPLPLSLLAASKLHTTLDSHSRPLHYLLTFFFAVFTAPTLLYPGAVLTLVSH